MVIAHSNWKREAPAEFLLKRTISSCRIPGEKMVKIEKIEEQLDGDQDDDCCEIDPAEFARKVHLKESDDVVIIASKGQIKVKVEVNRPEDFGKTLNGYHNSLTDCLDTNLNLDEYAAGDCKDNPYEIDEDETTPHMMENDEDKAVREKLSAKNRTGVLSDGKSMHVDKDECLFGEVIPDKLLVKCELEEDCIAIDEGVEEDAYDHLPEMYDFITGKSLVKCEPKEDSNDTDDGVEEDAYDHLPEMDDFNHEVYPEHKVFDDEDDDDVVVVRKEVL